MITSLLYLFIHSCFFSHFQFQQEILSGLIEIDI
jgi:hypothetical protein